MLVLEKKDLWFIYYLKSELQDFDEKSLTEAWYFRHEVETEVKYIKINEAGKDEEITNKVKEKVLRQSKKEEAKSKAKQWYFWIIEDWLLVWAMSGKIDISDEKNLVEIDEETHNESMSWKIFERKNGKKWKLKHDVKEIIEREWKKIVEWQNKALLKKS